MVLDRPFHTAPGTHPPLLNPGRVTQERLAQDNFGALLKALGTGTGGAFTKSSDSTRTAPNSLSNVGSPHLRRATLPYCSRWAPCLPFDRRLHRPMHAPTPSHERTIYSQGGNTAGVPGHPTLHPSGGPRLVGISPTTPLSGAILVGVLRLQLASHHTTPSPRCVWATRRPHGSGSTLSLSRPPRLVLGSSGHQLRNPPGSPHLGRLSPSGGAPCHTSRSSTPPYSRPQRYGLLGLPKYSQEDHPQMDSWPLVSDGWRVPGLFLQGLSLRYDLP